MAARAEQVDQLGIKSIKNLMVLFPECSVLYSYLNASVLEIHKYILKQKRCFIFTVYFSLLLCCCDGSLLSEVYTWTVS